jgi:hypothetical protein
MKKIFFFSAMLASITTSATVTVTPLGVDYATKKVTFSVSWTNSPAAPYNNRVWIWIDFCPVTGTTPGSFSPATITSPIKTGGNGTITNVTARGFFIGYSTTNAGTTVTATLSNAPAGHFNWCAYGSDYPPNVTLDNGPYTFKGTSDFIVSSHAQPVTTKTIARTSFTVNSSSTFTDATGCPGIGQLYCPYTGSDLIMDATHLCQQRTSGAKNWEAYIKDSRDNQIYRITQFSDGSWWFADDLAIAVKSVGTCSGKRYYVGNDKPSCPTAWRLPTFSEFDNRWKVSTCTDVALTDNYGAPLTLGCYYGVASRVCGGAGCDGCNTRLDYVFGDTNNTRCTLGGCGSCNWNCSLNGSNQTTATGIAGRARCMR